MNASIILKNALKIIKRRSNKVPTWHTVSKICLVGATTAIEMCESIGVNPHSDKFELLEESYGANHANEELLHPYKPLEEQAE